MATCGDLDFEARNIQFLEFELSNQCQLAKAHPWCPRHHLGTQPPVELSSRVVSNVVEFFAGYDFAGTVYFSIYNEPLLDPRTPDLIAYVRRMMPRCLVQMYSNGLALTPDLARRLVAAGLGMFRLSVYAETRGRVNPAALDILAAGGVYLAPIERNGPESYGAGGWDERLGIYDRDAGCHAPCYMPIQYLCFTCRGDAMLCWDDWQGRETYGNALCDTVGSILTNPARLAKLAALKAGRRDGVCRGCARPTELCISEYRGRLRLE